MLSAAGGREPDALSRSELAALPTLTEVARALADEPCGGADRTLPRLTVELKGASATPGGARAVAAVARAIGVGPASPLFFGKLIYGFSEFRTWIPSAR